MGDAAQHEDTPKDLAVAPIDDAIRSAESWPWDEPSALDGISVGEWDAFIDALKSR